MKLSFLKGAALVLVLSVGVTACEGPSGPAGPPGSDGLAGPVGPAGQDANQTCTHCHVNDMKLYAKQQQFALSDHGSDYYTRSSGLCVNCHSHQGFLARVATGSWNEDAWETDDFIVDAMPMNCRTCHQIHTTYTEADLAFNVQGPVAFYIGDESRDLGPAANLCATCHQQRPLRERYGDLPVIDGPDVTFLSSSWSPHGSMQGNMFGGFGFFDFEGDLGGMSGHGTDQRSRGCPSCHMAETSSLSTGGHTFVVSEDACETCHASDDDGFDKFGQQTTVTALLDELAVLLEASGVIYWDAGRERWRGTVGTHPANHAAAYWNFLGVRSDGSLGVHNPRYVQGLLRGSITEMGG